jgi:hypothetical protein
MTTSIASTVNRDREDFRLRLLTLLFDWRPLRAVNHLNTACTRINSKSATTKIQPITSIERFDRLSFIAPR